MDHEFYMQQALALAREAAAHGEVPVGGGLVRDGQVSASGRGRARTARLHIFAAARRLLLRR